VRFLPLSDGMTLSGPSPHAAGTDTDQSRLWEQRLWPGTDSTGSQTSASQPDQCQSARPVPVSQPVANPNNTATDRPVHHKWGSNLKKHLSTMILQPSPIECVLRHGPKKRVAFGEKSLTVTLLVVHWFKTATKL
jgi:hypothetical protein